MMLSAEISGFKIEIKLNSIDDLKNAYLVLLDLKSRFHEIEQKHKIRIIAEKCKMKTKQYWIETDNKRIIQGVDDKPIGMMISLIDVYPESKKGSLVASEVGISHPAVSRYFSGSLGEHSDYFEEKEDGWRLSEEGVIYLENWIGAKESQKQ